MEPTSYQFGPFLLCPSEQLLLRDGKQVPLAPKAFDLLTVLVASSGRLLSREELLEAVWKDSFVEEINLTVNISLLRKALGTGPDGGAYIATVPKRGYRFTAPVRIEAGRAPLPEKNGIAPARDRDADEAALGALSAERWSPVAVAEEPAPEPQGNVLLAEPVPLPDPAAATPRSRPPWLTAWAMGAVLVLAMAVLWLRAERKRATARASSAAAALNSQVAALVQRGRTLLDNGTVEGMREGINLFNQAVALDPNAAIAYAARADAYMQASSSDSSFLAPSVSAPRAQEAVQKALSLDANLAEAHVSLANYELLYEWDWDGAEREYRKAFRLRSNLSEAHVWFSRELLARGNFAESHLESDQALALDPTGVLVNEHMAFHHLLARQYDTAIAQATKTIEMDGNFALAHRTLGLAYLYKGEGAKACAELETEVRLTREEPVARAYLARCEALTGRKDDALKIAAELEADAHERYLSAAEIAGIYAAAEEQEIALHWLEVAVRQHATALLYLNVDPVWDGMRSLPAFQDVVRQVHLQPSPVPLHDDVPRMSAE